MTTFLKEYWRPAALVVGSALVIGFAFGVGGFVAAGIAVANVFLIAKWVD